MNRSILFSVLLCSMISTVSVKAGWYASLLNLGSTIQDQMKESPKVIGCAAAVICAATLGYSIFDKLRDHEINKRLEDELQQFANAAPLDANRMEKINISVWGKQCEFEIKTKVNHAIGCVMAHRNNKLVKVLDVNKI